MIGRNRVNLIVGWCGQFLFFVVLRQFSQVGEWPENQILIPDWTYFHCPGATLLGRTIFIICCPSSIFTRHWRVATKSNFDSPLDLFPLSYHHPYKFLLPHPDYVPAKTLRW